jgi:cation diffusion facilitator CzcD-associated flavoprotein CzcO
VAEHFDVIIVGAGLSGIGAARHLKHRCPEKTFTLLESREATGGTWDLFKYPGIRSDSDMFTLGYSFKPWTEVKALADGPSILRYIRETAREEDIESKIRLKHKVVAASWSTPDARWTLEVDVAGERKTLTCNFLWMCAGYYSYTEAYTPDFPGRDRFRGEIVHPQFWTDQVDYANKRVVVIGSGATAVTLVPELAKKAAHVVMLQRSPTYILSRPAVDSVASWLREKLPSQLAYDVSRWKNVAGAMVLYTLSRRRPQMMRKWIKDLVKKELPDVDVEKHFNPRYDPWDQRLCLVPDNDLFEAVRAGTASVVTDTIETFTEKGLKLRSGDELEADLIVTATGLKLQFAGAVKLTVDGQPVDVSKTMNYKGSMFSDVPNMVCVFGYTNASWTLKADLVAEFVCRILKYMQATGTRVCTPRKLDPELREEPFVDFSSGYVTRALAELPKQGSKFPWRLYQNYALDVAMFRLGKIDDGSLVFS